MKDNFKLEFLNRIDEIVLFRSLTPAGLEKIVDLELAKVEKRLHNKNISLRISPKVKNFWLKKVTILLMVLAHLNVLSKQ